MPNTFGLNDEAIPGTSQDVIRLGAEIIELKNKPSVPNNSTSLDAMGRKPKFKDLGVHKRAIIAIGEQDVSFLQLKPLDKDVVIFGASSDHLILDVTNSKNNYKLGGITYLLQNIAVCCNV